MKLSSTRRLKVLHAAMIKNPGIGIANQLATEQRAAMTAALPWATRIFSLDRCGDGPLGVPHAGVPNSWLGFRRAFYRWVSAQQSHYDAILLRYSAYDLLQLQFLRHAETPVFLVHHTLEVPEFRAQNWRARYIKAPMESLIGPRSQRLAAGIIGVTGEVLRYECARSGVRESDGYVYPNGIDFETTTLVDDHRTSTPTFLFVGSNFYPWHGLDLLLEALRARPDVALKVDLVGVVTGEQRLLISRDRRVVSHGRLPMSQIRLLAAKAHAGLSSFALHRNHMREACTLKVRDYLSLGLPVYAGHCDVFPGDFPYFRAGECTVEALIDYAQNMAHTERMAVAQASRPYIDKQVLVEKLYSWLQARLNLL